MFVTVKKEISDQTRKNRLWWLHFITLQSKMYTLKRSMLVGWLKQIELSLHFAPLLSFSFFPRMMIYDIFWSKCKVVYLNPFTNSISVIFPKSYFTGYPCFLDLDSTWSKSYMHWNQTDCWYKVEEKIDNLWDNESLLEAAKKERSARQNGSEKFWENLRQWKSLSFFLTS